MSTYFTSSVIEGSLEQFHTKCDDADKFAQQFSKHL